jgi:hypothetical protein
MITAEIPRVSPALAQKIQETADDDVRKRSERPGDSAIYRILCRQNL